MFKLHKKDKKDNLLYAECWIDDEIKGIVHIGKMGKEGETEEFIIGGKFKTSTDFLNHFKVHFKDLGYVEFKDEDLTWLMVQFPMKSLKGNKRDHWLSDIVSRYLNSELGWKGIGHVDGSEMGELVSFKGQYALNILCEVYDEDKGIAAIKRCLREYRLDYTRIKIASRPYLSNVGFQLKYSAKKKDQTFSI